MHGVKLFFFLINTFHIVCLGQMMCLYKETLWEINPVFFRRPFSLATLNVREVIGFLNPSICLWLSIGVGSQIKIPSKVDCFVFCVHFLFNALYCKDLRAP